MGASAQETGVDEVTDENFRALCNTYGFAPSRALREMIEVATAQAAIDVLAKSAARAAAPADRTVTVRYDLGAAETDAAIRRRLIELGWTPPGAGQAQPKMLRGWLFRRNADGTVGIFAPPPRPGESQRTSDCIGPGQRDLHELLGKLADHMAATAEPTTDDSSAVEPAQGPLATMTVREDMGADFKFNRPHTLLPGQQFRLHLAPLQRKEST